MVASGVSDDFTLPERLCPAGHTGDAGSEQYISGRRGGLKSVKGAATPLHAAVSPFATWVALAESVSGDGVNGPIVTVVPTIMAERQQAHAAIAEIAAQNVAIMRELVLR